MVICTSLQVRGVFVQPLYSVSLIRIARRHLTTISTGILRILSRSKIPWLHTSMYESDHEPLHVATLVNSNTVSTAGVKAGRFISWRLDQAGAPGWICVDRGVKCTASQSLSSVRRLPERKGQKTWLRLGDHLRRPSELRARSKVRCDRDHGRHRALPQYDRVVRKFMSCLKREQDLPGWNANIKRYQLSSSW